jgi:hypothetical protein
MVSLNASKNKGRGNGGNSNGGSFSARENVMVQVIEVHEANENKPTPKEDTITAALLHDAYGLTAEFEPDTTDPETGEIIPGAPKTLITARIDVSTPNRYRNPDPAKQPTEMWDLKVDRRKGTGAYMGPNALVVLEKSRLNQQTGEVEVQFLKVAQHELNQDNELAITNVMATVGAEREKVKADGTVEKKQDRKIYMVEEASLVTNMEELKAALKDKLEDGRGERPFAVIHMVGRDVQPTEMETVDDDGNKITVPRYPYEARSAVVYLGYDHENKVQLSAEDSIEAWFTEPAMTRDGKPVYARDENNEIVKDAEGNPVPALRNAETIDLIEAYLGHEAVMFEVIGGFAYNTGLNSLPSTKGRMSDHWNYQVDWENRETGLPGQDKDGNKYVTQGIARSHMLLGRVKKRNELGPWYAQKTFTTKAFGAHVFLERELITPNTPAEIAEVFTAQAERRAKAKAEEIRARNNNAAAPKEDDNIATEDNAPDYSGGIAMGR